MQNFNTGPDLAKGEEPKKILLVEDDRSHRALMDKILQGFGFTTVQAENGVSALSKLQGGERYDLIIMDWDMPELDGLDTTRAIRAREQSEGHRHTPILAFTSNRNAGDREQCLAAGMDGYLPKDIWMPKWRQTLTDNLQGLIAGDFNLLDFNSPAGPCRSRSAASDSEFEYALDEFDEQTFSQAAALLKEDMEIAVEEFLEDAEEYIQRIATGLQNHDVVEMAKASHPLKSNSKSFGLLSVSKLAEAINAICERTENQEVALKPSGMLLPKLENAFLYGAQILKNKTGNTETYRTA